MTTVLWRNTHTLGRSWKTGLQAGGRQSGWSDISISCPFSVSLSFYQVRNHQREGLIRSKNRGAKEARGEAVKEVVEVEEKVKDVEEKVEEVEAIGTIREEVEESEQR